MRQMVLTGVLVVSVLAGSGCSKGDKPQGDVALDGPSNSTMKVASPRAEPADEGAKEVRSPRTAPEPEKTTVANDTISGIVRDGLRFAGTDPDGQATWALDVGELAKERYGIKNPAITHVIEAKDKKSVWIVFGRELSIQVSKADGKVLSAGND